MITIIRVLQIVPTMGYGGIAMMMKNYAEKLREKGVVIDFVHHGKRENYHDDLEILGSHLFILPNMTSVGVLQYTRMLREIIQINGPYDLIHTNMNYRAVLDARIAQKCGVEKRIIHVHGKSLHHGVIKFLIPVISLLMKKYGTNLLADSEDCGKFYYRHNHYDVIPVSVNLAEYANVENRRNKERQKLGLDENDFAIGQIAAFVAVKNHVFGINVLKQLVENNGGKIFKLFLAGDGALRSTIEGVIENEGLSDHVRLMGNISDIPGFLSAMDATILPSFTEGLGQVLIQSQAAGVMCYASDTIPRESDMGIELIKYLPITGEDAVVRWQEAIRATEKRNIPYAIRRNGINEKGYSVEVSAEKLLHIYGGNS